MLRNRLIALGLLILSLVAISFFGGPVSYGFFFFVLITLIVSAIYTAVVFSCFRIYQKINAKVLVAEKPVTFYFTLQNEKHFGFSGIRTDFFSDYSTISGLDPDIEYELFPQTGIEKETRLICKYRGEYEVGVKHVIVRDYLKIFSFTFKNKETITVRVNPQLVILDEMSTLDVRTLTSVDSYTNQTEPDVLVRDYIPGDDIRGINWNLTAATGKPVVRKRIGENTPAISIIMDSHRVSRNPDEYLPLENKILETTIALTYHLLSRGISVNVYAYQSGPVCFGLENTDDFQNFYAAMSAFSFDERSTDEKLFGYVSETPDIAKSSAVIFVLHELSDAYMVLKNELKRGTTAVKTCLVTNEAKDISEAVVIGYDAKLKEVLS